MRIIADQMQGVRILLSLLAAFAVLMICAEGQKETVISAAGHFVGMIRRKKRKADWYRRAEARLIRKGAGFHLGRRINPEKYYFLKLIFGVIGFGCGCSFSLTLGIMGLLVFFALPEFFLEYCNKRDNQKMLPDISAIYRSLAIQLEAGIHIADAVCECHRNIGEKRLKQAFLELAGDIMMNADLFGALEKLQAKFCNQYIDSLCITIIQMLESGQAVEALNDIGDQIRDMENVVLEKKKSALDRSITFYQLGIFLAELTVVLYACARYMFRMAGRF